VSEDIFEKELCHSCGIHIFVTRGDNHPLHKPMVNYNHDRVEAKGDREVSDQVHRDLLEWTSGRRDKGSQGGCRWVGIHLMRLTGGTAHDKSADEHIQAGPPKVPSDKVLGAEDATMAPCSRLMEGGDNIAASPLWDIEASLEVQLPIMIEPVLLAGMGKEGGSLVEGLEGREHKRVRGGGQGDLIGEGYINGSSEEVIGKECKLQIVVSSVNAVMAGEGIGGAHLGSRGVMEMQVEILQE
jgi:hypothetical protein